MFEINKYVYVDLNTKNKFEIYSRAIEFAEGLIERINKLGIFNFRKKNRGFCKKMISEIPPYEIELEQLKVIEKWEANYKY